MKLLSILAALTAILAPSVAWSIGPDGQKHAKGINCRGQATCRYDEWIRPWPGLPRPHPQQKTTAKKIHKALVLLPDNVFIPYNEQIACSRIVCAYIENPFGQGPPNGMYGRTVKALATALLEHGCHRCGHVPAGYLNGVNSDAFGRLTFDVQTACVNMATGAPNDNLYNGLCPKYAAIAARFDQGLPINYKRDLANGTVSGADEREELERIARGEYGRPVTDEWELESIFNSTIPSVEELEAMWAEDMFEDDDEEWTLTI